jgi:hypothetical protein
MGCHAADRRPAALESPGRAGGAGRKPVPVKAAPRARGAPAFILGSLTSVSTSYPPNGRGRRSSGSRTVGEEAADHDRKPPEPLPVEQIPASVQALHWGVGEQIDQHVGIPDGASREREDRIFWGLGGDSVASLNPRGKFPGISGTHSSSCLCGGCQATDPSCPRGSGACWLGAKGRAVDAQGRAAPATNWSTGGFE